MPFRCVYCAQVHPDEMRAEEHIIPRRLGNRSFVHRDTCARVNHALAHGVEKPFHEQSTVDEILLTLDPPKGAKPHFLASHPTARGVQENRFVHKGQFVLCEMPKLTRVDTIPVTMHRRDGSEVSYQLRLPFALLRAAEGSELLLAPMQKKLERMLDKSKRQVAEYASRLKNNPAVDPDFAQFIIDNDIVLREPDVVADAVKTTTPNDPVSDVLPREHVIDLEVAARYFVKTALLFAAESKQSALLSTPEGKALRQFLVAFLVDPAIACAPDGTRLPVFSEAAVAGGIVYWWSASILETTVTINTDINLSTEQRALLTLENASRVRRLNAIRHLLKFEKAGDIGPDFYASPRPYAYHDISLERDAGVWCKIQRRFRAFVSAEATLASRASIC